VVSFAQADAEWEANTGRIYWTASQDDSRPLTLDEGLAVLGVSDEYLEHEFPLGSGAALLTWPPSPLTFHRGLLLRYARARNCPKPGGPCRQCDLVILDSSAIAEHVLFYRHKFGDCQECETDWDLVQPCT
jgi:hypothetical protein